MLQKLQKMANIIGNSVFRKTVYKLYNITPKSGSKKVHFVCKRPRSRQYSSRFWRQFPSSPYLGRIRHSSRKTLAFTVISQKILKSNFLRNLVNFSINIFQNIFSAYIFIFSECYKKLRIGRELFFYLITSLFYRPKISKI